MTQDQDQDQDQEEWRKLDIEGTRCIYYASNHGRIKSLSKKYGDNERLVKPWISGNGYYYVEIGDRSKTIHSLISNLFMESKPSLTHTIDHIDRNSANNHISNLRWATKSEQIQNSSVYRHDITENDPLLRRRILNKESIERLGYNDKVECGCGKTYQQYRKTRHEKTNYHLKRIQNQDL